MAIAVATRAGDQDAVLAVFDAERLAHPYGIADVEQLWDVSRWWVRGHLAVGLVDLPGSDVPVVYAVSVRDPKGCLALLVALMPELPDRVVIHGPRGLSRRLAPDFATRWSKPYVKMALIRPERLPPRTTQVSVLGTDDLPALEALYATDPSAGDFFHAGLLDTGAYLGLYDGSALAATAGVHVLDPVRGVAAVGNVVTDPAFRRQGLSRAVTGELCHRLRADVEVVGLNVGQDNGTARALYTSLGFDPVTDYEEAELERVIMRGAGAARS